MPPVRDAVRLVDHQQGDPVLNCGKEFIPEVIILQLLGRDEQHVDLVALDCVLDPVPFTAVVGAFPFRADSHPLRRLDLVAHQRQQRRDEERRSVPGLAQQFGGDEVDEALAPAGALHDQ